MRIHTVSMALLAAACGSDDDPRLGGDLVGTWRALPSAASMNQPPPEADRYTLWFAGDGTMTAGGFGGTPAPTPGTYTTDGDNLIITTAFANSTRVVSVPYHANADRLAYTAMVPDGAADGFIGTWSSTARLDGAGESRTITLRGDATATITYASATQPATDFAATWRAVGADVEITSADLPVLQFTRIDDVLGAPFERVPQ